jgi:superfamily II DNA or RNA helicase
MDRVVDFDEIERDLPTVTDDPVSRQRRGKAFEKLCLWLLSSDPVLASELRRAWLWSDWPERSGPDQGIDIVVEGSDGLWAVQCKASNPDAAVTKREIDSFLTAAGPKFVRRILFSTSDRISSNALRSLDDHQVIVYGRKAFARADVDWSSYRRGSRSKCEPLAARAHQHEAIQKVVSALSVGARGQVHMPCGTGKTLVAQRASEQLDDRRIVVAVPTLGLLAQTLRSWARNTTRPFHALAVCSDDSVTNEDSETIAAHEIPAMRTSDPMFIKNFLCADNEPRVIFTTYNSATNLLQKAQALGAPTIDLLIADEAHRLVGGGTFAGVLHDSKVRASRRLMLTATPRIFDRSSRAGEDLRELSMDNEVLYGPVLFAMSFRQAIEQDLLADYEVIVLLVSDTSATNLVKLHRKVAVDGLAEPHTPAREIACAVALLHGANRHSIRTAISFHSSVKGAQRFPELLTYAATHAGIESIAPQKVWARSITGADPAQQRAQLLGELVAGTHQFNLISNARCLAEGIDVPALDSVAFVDPRYSQIDIVQAIGRAIRRHPSKGTGKIVIPVPVSSASAHGEIERTEFHAVYRVFRALRAHDRTLAEQLDSSRVQLVTGRQCSLPSRVSIDTTLVSDVLAAGFLKAFHPIVLEETTDAWIVHYHRLLEWAGEGDGRALTMRRSGMPENLKRWASKQRQLHSGNLLSVARRKLLEAISGWAWDADDAEWILNYEATQGFRALHGRLPMTRDDVFDGRNVGAWLAKQRAAGRADSLSAERLSMLESLEGFVVRHRDERFWRPHAAYLTWAMGATREAVARGPRTGEAVDDIDLAGWSDNMRLRRRRKQAEGGDIPDWQLSAINELPGWRWEAGRNERNDLEFQRKVDVIRVYCAESDRSSRDIVQTFEWNGDPVGAWISNWRSSRDKLPEHRRDLLEALPEWTWSKNSDKETWTAKLAELADFGKRRGHIKPSIKAPQEQGEKELGVWKRNNKNRLRGTATNEALSFYALLAEYEETP